jgi:DNA-binding XRE family transcriptional regulator
MAATLKSDGASLKDDAEIELRLEVYDALAKTKGADTVQAQADLHGIGRQHMSEIRAGKSQPSLKLGLRMAADLGTTVEALFKRRGA